MKVEMITLAAGPDGVLEPGQVVRLPKETAEALIAGGYAKPAAEEAEETPAPKRKKS